MIIFGIDKVTDFDTIVSTILVKLSLSKGGGGWKKTFRSSAIQSGIFLMKVSSTSKLESPF